MRRTAIPALLLAVAAPLVLGAEDPRAPGGIELAQLSIHERIIIRIPRLGIGTRRTLPVSAPIEWREKKGPKCLSPENFAGAMVSGKRSVDLMLSDGRRMRARLNGDCRPLDYYPGFYIKPGADGQVCRDRDSILVRSGASCPIDDFRMLVAKR